MDNGWIKLHRQITGSMIWCDDEPFDRRSAWIDILLMVNHQDKKVLVNGKLVTIKRGETLTSIVKLADRWHWSRNRVKRFLDTLDESGMCTTDRSTNGTTLKVSNYAKYQDFQRISRTTVEPTDEPTNGPTDGPVHEPTDEPTNGPQTIIYKNDKNDKEEREGQAPRSHFVPSFDFIEGYCADHHLKLDVERFMAYYGAREWTLGNGMKVKTKDQLINLIKSWTTSVVAKDEEKKTSDGLMPYHEVSQGTARLVGVDVPFEGGLVAEMIRRKRAKNV